MWQIRGKTPCLCHIQGRAFCLRGMSVNSEITVITVITVFTDYSVISEITENTVISEITEKPDNY